MTIIHEEIDHYAVGFGRGSTKLGRCRLAATSVNQEQREKEPEGWLVSIKSEKNVRLMQAMKRLVRFTYM